MSSHPTPTEILVAVGTMLKATTRGGQVVVNAIYKDSQIEYLSELKVDGVINGWLVGIGSEQPPTRSSAGFEQIVNVICTPAVGAGGTIGGQETFEYFGEKVQEAKDAAAASEDLGLASGGTRVRNHGLYAPNGYYPLETNEYAVWVGPDMILPVWISQC